MSSRAFRLGVPRSAYVEREDPQLGWLDQAGTRAAGSVIRRLRAQRRRARRLAARVEELAPDFTDLTDAGIRQQAEDLRRALWRDGFRDEPVARAFALVRETADRRLGLRHYPVQLMGGWVLLQGMVAEMETGEGKTLTATLAACTAALARIPVHVITVNDYLVERDARDMGEVYRALGLTVGVVRHGMDPAARRASYAADVTYCSNKELVFDYLRDRIALGPARGRARLLLERMAGDRSPTEGTVLRGLCFGIVDEADSVLVDEARTPLIISAQGELDDVEAQTYERALDLAGDLAPGQDFQVDERERSIRLTAAGQSRLSEWSEPLSGIWRANERREGFVTQALGALHLFNRDRHYLVADGKVQIVDEYTGRRMPDRSWEHGLHQLIEAKEGCEMTGRTEALAKISYQRFFRRYLRLSGMTGTAREVATELWSTYRMGTIRVPTQRPLRRHDGGDHVYDRADAKWSSIAERIATLHREGRPVLVGTRSVAASDDLSRELTRLCLPHQVLSARQDEHEAEIIARAGESGRITVATNMAGRGTDIRLDEAAQAAGGLHVIATERHEAGRIDRQLFGRGGRQGDPGSYEAFASLEDDLVRAHGGRLTRHAFRLPAIRKLVVRRAQRRAERLHGRIRKQLLETDDKYASFLAFSGRGE